MALITAAAAVVVVLLLLALAVAPVVLLPVAVSKWKRRACDAPITIPRISNGFPTAVQRSGATAALLSASVHKRGAVHSKVRWFEFVQQQQQL
jgi:hypothetical protein